MGWEYGSCMNRQSVLKRQRLLLVENEPEMALALTGFLKNEGYYVTSVASGRRGLDLASDSEFDAIVLDLTLPDGKGADVCRSARLRGVHTPILILTERGELEDRIRCLNLGADDYLVKPFDMAEFLARLQALIRRSTLAREIPRRHIYEFDGVIIDFTSAQVFLDGSPVELSAREFELLCYFIEHKGTILPRRQLLTELWGYDSKAQTRTIDVHVGLLRQKLERDPKNSRHFLTARRLGYKFVD